LEKWDEASDGTQKQAYKEWQTFCKQKLKKAEYDVAVLKERIVSYEL